MPRYTTAITMILGMLSCSENPQQPPTRNPSTIILERGLEFLLEDGLPSIDVTTNLVLLQFKDEKGDLRGYCNGGIIGRGYILTSAHCTESGIPLSGLYRQDGILQEFTADVVARSEYTDLALAKMRKYDAQSISLHLRRENLMPGEPITILSWYDEEKNLTFRRVQLSGNYICQFDPHFMLLDHELQPGMSGSLAFDAQNRIVGVTNAVLKKSIRDCPRAKSQLSSVWAIVKLIGDYETLFEPEHPDRENR